MKVSELIKALQAMQESYGDLKVSITVHDGPVTNTPAKIMSSEDIFLGYDQMEDHDEINIRSFPY